MQTRPAFLFVILLISACAAKKERQNDAGPSAPPKEDTERPGDNSTDQKGNGAAPTEVKSGTSVNNGTSSFDDAADAFAPLGPLFKKSKSELVSAGYAKNGDATVEWSDGEGAAPKEFVITVRYHNAALSQDATVTAKGKMRSDTAPSEGDDVQLLYSVKTDVAIEPK